MRRSEQQLYDTLKFKLETFQVSQLVGITSQESQDCFILQIIDSIRRIKYVRVIREKQPSKIYSDASVDFFDPIKAAVWNINQNNTEEAFWLVFLLTHFGKNKKTGWNLIRQIYGAMNNPVYWSWERTRNNFNDFQNWLSNNQDIIIAQGKFGNHRKYQSIDAHKPAGTGQAILSYINWISKFNNHAGLVNHLIDNDITDPKKAFNYLYYQLDEVISFGRTAKFDLLTMLGKLELIKIEPDSTYMHGATGPKAGARLLFGGDYNSDINPEDLSLLLNELEHHLDLYFGMQVLEDSLCNWQKSPSNYIHFRG
jgi:hypothetical protein